MGLPPKWLRTICGHRKVLSLAWRLKGVTPKVAADYLRSPQSTFPCLETKGDVEAISTTGQTLRYTTGSTTPTRQLRSTTVKMKRRGQFRDTTFLLENQRINELHFYRA